MHADTFSLARMRALICWQTSVRRAETLRSFSVLTVFFLFFELILGTSPGSTMPALCAVVTFFMVANYLFRAFNMRGDKAKRIGLLMLPTSNIEKFAGCTLFMALTGILNSVGAFFLADTLRWAFAASTGLFGQGPWCVPAFLHAFCDVVDWGTTSNSAIAGTVFFYSAGLWVLTFFLLMGTVLRRVSSGMMALLCFALIFLFSTLLVHLDEHILHALIWANSHATLAFSILTGAALALSALQVWLAYKVFCRLSLNYGKWTNL